MAIKEFLSKNLPVKRKEIVNPFLSLQQEMNSIFNRFSDNFECYQDKEDESNNYSD